MPKIACVVIDDEFLNRKLISMMVTKLNPTFVISGEAENIRDGYNLINTTKPAAVFLDIKMPDGSGFDLLRRFSTFDFEVVFITGFDEYILRAFEFNALDYVLKPIDMDKFKLTLDKLQTKIINNSVNPALGEIIRSYDIKNVTITKIPVHSDNKTILLGIDEIMYIQFEGGLTIFSATSAERFTNSRQLSDFDFILKNFQNFVKVDENTFINLDFIAAYSRGFKSFITMNNGATITISRAKRLEILQLVKKRTINR
jgi:two-component system LytT family response regulator